MSTFPLMHAISTLRRNGTRGTVSTISKVGMLVDSRAVPTFQMIDEVRSVPFHRSVDIACINGNVLNTEEDVARFRASLRLTP